MSKTARDAWFFGAMGLFTGALPAMLAAGAYAAWQRGGDLTRIGIWAIVEITRAIGPAMEPATTAVLLGGFVVGALALGLRRPPDSHGSARWAERSELGTRRSLPIAQPTILREKASSTTAR